MALEEELVEERDGVEIFAVGGMEEGEVDAEGVGAEGGAVAENDFAEDDWVAEGSFRVVIGGGHAVEAQEGEEAVVIALGIEQALTEVFRLWIGDGEAADAVKPTVQGRDLGLGIGKGDLARIAKAADCRGLGKEVLNVLAESLGVGVLLRRREQGDELGDFLGLANEMGETGLAILGFDEIVGGVIVGDEPPLETGSKNIERDLTGTGAVDVKEAEVGIAGEPDPSALAIDAPMGFIAVDEIGGADAVADLFVDGFGGLGGALLKSHGGGRDKVQAEDPLEDLAHISEGEVEFVTQENGGGFGGGTDGLSKRRQGGIYTEPAARVDLFQA